MARATPEPTPNPNAMKFNLDVALDAMFNASDPSDAPSGLPRAVLAIDGVASVFGTGSFVTVTRREGADWEPIVAAVCEAVAEHL